MLPLADTTMILLRQAADAWPDSYARVYLYSLATFAAAVSVLPAGAEPVRTPPMLDQLGGWIHYPDLDEALRRELDRAREIAVAIARYETYFKQARRYPVRHRAGPTGGPAPLHLSFASNAREPAEVDFLRNYGFWEGHTLFRELVLKDRSYLIYGPQGCGRSAFALMLSELDPDVAECRHTLTATLLPSADRKTMLRLLADEMLRFVCAHPVHLATLGVDERRLLAGFLKAALGAEWAGSRLGREAGELSLAHDLERPDQRAYASARLRELAALAQDSATPAVRLGRAYWRPRLLELIGFLDFRCIAFIYDAVLGDEAWLQEAILDQAAEWHTLRTSFLMFAPNSCRGHLRFDRELVAERELIWTRDRLRAMAVHRRGGGDTLFDEEFDDSFDHLLDHSYLEGTLSPRRLIQVWRAVRRHRGSGRTTRADIEAAVQSL